MADNREIRVPDIGNFEDVEIIEVLVSQGDQVKPEDSLITLESDKATMEIPSPEGGTVKELKVKLGDKVSEGDPILVLEAEQAIAGEKEAVTEAAAKPKAAEPPQPPQLEAQPAATPKPEPPPEPPPPAATAPRPSPTAHIEDRAFRKAHASPGIRRFARELGADLSQIDGTGPKGRILKDDVQSFVKKALTEVLPAPAVAPGTGIPPIPEVDFSKYGEIETKELNKIRKLSGTNLHRAWLNIPHVTHHDEADITELEAFRQSLKEEAAKEGVRITLLAFITKALVAALKEFPQFNASLATNGENLIYKKYYHIGVAVDTPNGLVVPVVRDANEKGILKLAAEMADLSARARQRKVKPDEMEGACMTVSSLGGIGGTAFAPIVNAPEVAILGVTRAHMKPVWNGKEFEPRLMLPLDLSYDHRVIDGAEAARFVDYLRTLLSDTRRLLL